MLTNTVKISDEELGRLDEEDLLELLSLRCGVAHYELLVEYEKYRESQIGKLTKS